MADLFLGVFLCLTPVSCIAGVLVFAVLLNTANLSLGCGMGERYCSLLWNGGGGGLLNLVGGTLRLLMCSLVGVAAVAAGAVLGLASC